jgi:1,2-phenylacetyl-CoA epoxidase catalytic subunit
VRSRSKQELKYHEEKTPSNYTSLKRSTDRSSKNSIQDIINDKYQFINAESQSNSKNIFSSSKNYKKNKIESQYRDKYNPNSIENVLNLRLPSNTNLKDK